MNNSSSLRSIEHELVIDNFAGGGGASTGIESAIELKIFDFHDENPIVRERKRLEQENTQHPN